MWYCLSKDVALPFCPLMPSDGTPEFGSQLGLSCNLSLQHASFFLHSNHIGIHGCSSLASLCIMQDPFQRFFFKKNTSQFHCLVRCWIICGLGCWCPTCWSFLGLFGPATQDWAELLPIFWIPMSYVRNTWGFGLLVLADIQSLEAETFPPHTWYAQTASKDAGAYFTVSCAWLMPLFTWCGEG